MFITYHIFQFSKMFQLKIKIYISYLLQISNVRKHSEVSENDSDTGQYLPLDDISIR